MLFVEEDEEIEQHKACCAQLSLGGLGHRDSRVVADMLMLPVQVIFGRWSHQCWGQKLWWRACLPIRGYVVESQGETSNSLWRMVAVPAGVPGSAGGSINDSRRDIGPLEDLPEICEPIF